ncbi:MAG: response regulator, partial [Symploca sp. SIO2E6]|nr:response regulator [Symploca sp. SIO2E6]
MDNPPVKVLLVDDDEDDYALTRDLLAESPTNFELEWVATYKVALDSIEHNQYDIYLFDYRLGERNGLELLREAITLGCQGPIILLTGQGDQGIDIEAMKAGAADYLDKSQISSPWLERSIRYSLERQQAQQKIREQAALLDVATDGILVINLHNQILFWNQGAQRMYGWYSEEVLDKNAHQLLGKEETLPRLLEIQQIVVQEGNWYGELQQVNHQGKEITVQSRWALVQNYRQQPQSILIVNTDITQKKQLEAQFLRAQRMESIGTLAGGIAHDLNNVLAPILMSVQLLALSIPDDDRCQQWLEILENNTKRGADLVKQVVSFARGIKGDCTVVQVRHLLREIKQIAQETFPKSIKIKTDIPPDLWTVSGDATQLHQVFMNLCVNARDALTDGGTLTITGQNLAIDEHYAEMNLDAQVGLYIVITVADTGVGIPPEILDRIFEPFFTTKEVGQGTGLGLSTVMGIIKSHGGFVNVYSELGEGTKFKVYLPAVKTADSEPVEQLELPLGQRELVLVVDDEAAIREITKTSLETYKYRVMTASNGIEAIALYAEHKTAISIVLIDMMMPEMNGPNTIRTIQKINPQVKIIAVSGLAASDKLNEVTKMGINTFLYKPYTAKELLTTIRGVMS